MFSRMAGMDRSRGICVLEGERERERERQTEREKDRERERERERERGQTRVYDTRKKVNEFTDAPCRGVADIHLGRAQG